MRPGEQWHWVSALSISYPPAPGVLFLLVAALVAFAVATHKRDVAFGMGLALALIPWADFGVDVSGSTTIFFHELLISYLFASSLMRHGPIWPRPSRAVMLVLGFLGLLVAFNLGGLWHIGSASVDFAVKHHLNRARVVIELLVWTVVVASVRWDSSRAQTLWMSCVISGGVVAARGVLAFISGIPFPGDSPAMLSLIPILLVDPLTLGLPARYRRLTVPLLGIFAVSGMLSWGRAATAGMVVSTLIAILLMRRSRPVFFAVAGGCLALGSLLDPTVSLRVRSIVEPMLVAYTYERLQLWQDALRIIGDYPVIGVGLGNYPGFKSEVTGETMTGAHNTYLTYVSETGMLGIAVGLAALVPVLVTLLRSWRDQTSPFASTALAITGGMMTMALAQDTFPVAGPAELRFLLTGWTIVIVALSERTSPRRSTPQ